MNHPFHIHGHHWRVMRCGTAEELYLDPNRFQIDSSRKNPLARDSVAIPSGGYVIVRFIADNPGKEASRFIYNAYI